MRALSEIIIHCSATRPEWMAKDATLAKVAEIRRWHLSDRGWRDIGYHYIIDRNGTLATGRPLEKVGAHVQGRNTGTIGVCLIGGHGSAETDPFAKHYTIAQEKALRRLLADLRKRYPTIKAISGHNQFAAKACPGFNVPKWLGEPQVNEAPKTEHDAPDVLKPEPRVSVWRILWAALAAVFVRDKRK